MGSAKAGRARKLSVAITGPTGAIGLALVDALEQTPEVQRIVGMARSPFDVAVRGWRKTEYLQGDVTEALLLIDNLAPFQPGSRLPEPLAGLLRSIPFAKPILPDPGVRLQVVHQDDVASALCAAILGRGRPGVYNLAARGELTMTDIADELGWYSVPLPGVAVEVAAELVAQVPYLPSGARWIDAMRVPVIMSSDKARAELGWRPRYDAMETLRETIAAAFGRGAL